MKNVCICKDQVASGQRSNDRMLDWIRCKIILEWQVMHISQVFHRIDVVMRLQAAQSCAVLQQIFFTQCWNFLPGNLKMLTHIVIHARLDCHPQTHTGWIQRIIEVEENRGDSHSEIIQLLPKVNLKEGDNFRYEIREVAVVKCMIGPAIKNTALLHARLF